MFFSNAEPKEIKELEDRVFSLENTVRFLSSDNTWVKTQLQNLSGKFSVLENKVERLLSEIFKIQKSFFLNPLMKS